MGKFAKQTVMPFDTLEGLIHLLYLSQNIDSNDGCCLILASKEHSIKPLLKIAKVLLVYALYHLYKCELYKCEEKCRGL